MSVVVDQELGVSKNALTELVGEILSEARLRGATQAAAAASIDTGLSVSCRLGEVETVEYQRDRGLGVTVYFGKCKGTASTADLSLDQVKETVAKACSIAGYTQEDDCAGLADPERMPKTVRDLDLNHPWDLGPDEAIALTQRCESVALNYDQRIQNSEGASVSRHQGLRVYGNSHGFVGGYHTTSHSLSCSVVGKEGETMERDYWYTAGRNPAMLESAEFVGEKAAQRTIRRLGAQKIATRKAAILFPPELARGLLSHSVGALGGGSQYREASFLLKAAGEQVFPEFVNFLERPHLLQAAGSAPFDSEGVETVDRALVSEGVIQGYVLNSYSGRKLKLPTTGNAGGVHNLVVSEGDQDFEAMVKNMGTGFLVSELIGHGVNLVTGDYSRGAAGFWVENGSIQFPVHEVTIAGNLREMYRNIVAIGNDVDTRGSLRCGSVLLEEMTVAGN